MSHAHHHHHHDHEFHNATSASIAQAFVLNLVFTLIELIGGVLTNSLAILSDAIHDLGDTLSLGLAWYFERLAQKQRDATFSYGYKRFSLLAAVINACVLIGGAIYICITSIPHLWAPEPTHVPGMLGLAILGILFNGLAFLRLQKQSQSQNARVVMLHLLEDILGWVAIFLGSCILYFYPWYILDALLALGIALFILWNALKSLKESLNIFLQVIPAEVDLEGFQNEILALPEIQALHDLHLWSLDGQKHILTLHLVLDKPLGWAEQRQVKQQIKTILKTYQIFHMTLEFELATEACDLENC